MLQKKKISVILKVRSNFICQLTDDAFKRTGGAILKDCYHQPQKHLTHPTYLSPKPQFNCFRNQKEIHDSVIPCHGRTPLLAWSSNQWHSCHMGMVCDTSLLPWDYKQAQADQRNPPNDCRSALRWVLCGSQHGWEAWGSPAHHCTHPVCAASLWQGSELNHHLQHLLQTHSWKQTHLDPHSPQHARV